MTRTISENSFIKLSIVSGSVAAIFIASTFISVGVLINQQAQASNDIKDLKADAALIKRDQAESREKLYGAVSEMSDRLARIEGKLDRRKVNE